MDAHQAKMDADNEEMMVKLNAEHERIMSCLGKTEATNFKANPEEMQSEAEHREVPKMPQWKLAERRISGGGTGV
jgi:non-ribosomal peptide synthetase component E (peptide arylation enzyme)